MNKQVVYRAGLIPYRVINNQIEMMFMIPSDQRYGGDKPQVSKGKVEDGEDFKHAALREAKEELGLLESQIEGEIHELGLFLGRMTMFYCKVGEDAIFGMPGSESADVMWLTLEQFKQQGRELHLPMVSIAHHLISINEQPDN